MPVANALKPPRFRVRPRKQPRFLIQVKRTASASLPLREIFNSGCEVSDAYSNGNPAMRAETVGWMRRLILTGTGVAAGVESDNEGMPEMRGT